MTPEEAEHLLHAAHVKRWTIVAVDREQSVAEHSYLTWVLALSLYDTLCPVPHNSFERESVAFWALVHDAEEIWTGDLPSNIKAIFEELAPGTLKKVKEEVLGRYLPSVASAYRGTVGSFVEAVVKLAETVEAYTYFRAHAIPGPNHTLVSAFLRDRVDAAVLKLAGHPNRVTDASVEAAAWLRRMLER